jgi:hypothetical protein
MALATPAPKTPARRAWRKTQIRKKLAEFQRSPHHDRLFLVLKDSNLSRCNFAVGEHIQERRIGETVLPQLEMEKAFVR